MLFLVCSSYHDFLPIGEYLTKTAINKQLDPTGPGCFKIMLLGINWLALVLALTLALALALTLALTLALALALALVLALTPAPAAIFRIEIIIQNSMPDFICDDFSYHIYMEA